MQAVMYRLRSEVSIASLNSSPSTAMGSVPMMISQPMRASGSWRLCACVSEAHQARKMRTMSCRKYSSTAASVPIWVQKSS